MSLAATFLDAHVRHAMLREALEIIRLLFSGGYHSYDGRYLRLSDARLFDLPDRAPMIAVAASSASARIAAELGDGLFGTEPKPHLVEHYRDAGGEGPRYAEVPVAWAPDENSAAQAALEMSRWAVTGWKVMSELPNPVNFAAASATVRENDILSQFACGADPSTRKPLSSSSTRGLITWCCKTPDRTRTVSSTSSNVNFIGS